MDMSMTSRTRSPTLRPIASTSPTFRNGSMLIANSIAPSSGVSNKPARSDPMTTPSGSAQPGVALSTSAGPSAANTTNIAGGVPLPRFSSGNVSSKTANVQPRLNNKASPPIDTIMNDMTVRVALVGGRGFEIIQDSNASVVGDVPDIYCSFAVGSQVCVTSTLQNTLNPRW
jgi:hypothetical protein